jgi:hypothetical protein
MVLRNQTTAGIVIIVLTVFAMSTADMIVKLFSSALPLWQIYVVRSLIVIPILAGFAIFRRDAIRITPVSPDGWRCAACCWPSCTSSSMPPRRC